MITSIIQENIENRIIKSILPDRPEPQEIPTKIPDSSIDFYNTASYEDLVSINGIGPSIAEGIIGGRPWQERNELARIRGISKIRLDEWEKEIQH